MSTILPIRVLRHIKDFISTPSIVYYDNVNGRLIKRNIVSGNETSINDALYNVVNKDDVLSVCYNNYLYYVNIQHSNKSDNIPPTFVSSRFRPNTKTLFLYKNEWIQDNHLIHTLNLYRNNTIENITMYDCPRETTHPGSLYIFVGFYFEYLVYRGYDHYMIYDNNTGRIIEKLNMQITNPAYAHSNRTFHWMFARNNTLANYRYNELNFNYDSFVANVNHNGHSVNIYWANDSRAGEVRWKIVIMEKEKYKTYKFVSHFGYRQPIFVYENTIVVIHGYKIIMCRLNGFELELVKCLDIETDYDKLYFSHNRLYVVDGSSIYEYCLEKETNHMSLVGHNDNGYKILNIELDLDYFDFYIQEAIEYKEQRYASYIEHTKQEQKEE
jgi:hypothetical protein